jgi:LuxR family maltose regulon positive regulatory protein
MVRVLADDSWATEALAIRFPPASEAGAVSLLRELRGSITAQGVNARANTVQDAQGSLPRLTTREVQILRLVWRGSSNKAIASALFLTENTIETHLRRIYQKLGTRKRTQAAAIAREAGAI